MIAHPNPATPDPHPEPSPTLGLELYAPGVQRLAARIAEEQRAAEQVMTTSVRGPRGQRMTLAEAAVKASEIGNRIELDEARGSLRHRTVGRLAKVLTVLFLGVIDFPIMLWLASSVFNVDWSAPFGLPLAMSVVISLLGTGGAAWTLHHLGHNRRENKTDQRHLKWAEMSIGAKASVVAVTLLAAIISVVMFVRVYTEGVLSGLSELALLLAVLVAFIMLLSASSVFGTAFRDGSLEQDDLAHYSKLVHEGLQRMRDHEDHVVRLRHERDMLLGSVSGLSAGVIRSAGDTRQQGTTVVATECATESVAPQVTETPAVDRAHPNQIGSRCNQTLRRQSR